MLIVKIFDKINTIRLHKIYPELGICVKSLVKFVDLKNYEQVQFISDRFHYFGGFHDRFCYFLFPGNNGSGLGQP